MLKSKIVHLKKIYKFRFDYFLEKLTVFILIKKTLKIKSCGFRSNNARYEKMFGLRKRTVFVLNVKNVIKNQKLNFSDKFWDIQKKC